MRKLIFAIVTILMFTSVSAMAQVFMDDEDLDTRNNRLNEPGAIIPEQDVKYDQYEPFVPMGEGAFMLSMLGGAYLLGKRKRKENK